MGSRDLTFALALLFSLWLTGSAAGGAQPAQKLDPRLQEARGETVRVVVEARAARGPARAAVAAAGGAVQAEYADLVEAVVPAAALARIAASDAVRYVRPPIRFFAHAVTSEGVAATGAAAWHRAGWTGAGVRIAVVDLGFAGLAAAQATGDLPASVTRQDFCFRGFDGGGEPHGTAVAEIAHDMAPHAELFLVCADSDVRLGQAKDYVKSLGIPIVNFSAGAFNTSRGDGNGGEATPDAVVQDARASGILWVNSAGNQAQEHWSGAFSDPDGNGFHNFAASDEANTVTVPRGGEVCAFLKWDEWPTTDQDYDVHVGPNASGRRQTGSQPPTDEACYTNTGSTPQTVAVRIRNVSAQRTPRLDLFVVGGSRIRYYVPAGSVVEPATSPHALAVGAICWQNDALAFYSSQGPTIDGRVKPDLAAPDSVSTTTYGLFAGSCPSGFPGTSASAPHVAGAAALVKQRLPGSGPGELQASLEASARDLGEPGKDSLFGAGKLLLPSPVPDTTAPTVPTFAAPAARFQLARTFAVSWSATDAGTGVASYDVRFRQATYRGGLGPWRAWRSATAATRASFPGVTGRSYCFSARARDHAGNTSAWSRARCTAVPLNNGAFAHRGAWTKRTGAGYYLNTFSAATARGAALVRTGIRAKHLALVATRCPRCGTVAVYWNGTLVRRINLAAATPRKKRRIAVRSFARVRSGTVRIVVTSARKPVRIEGFGVAKP